MKIKFHTSVAGLSYNYDANLVYDLPLEEAANCIRLGWASAVEAPAPPISETRQIKAEKATSRKQKEKR
ncbi:MAG: hypothetical protein EBU46_10030 [Nitrosomonadaceae bacterium]|nr:hypothetical protein [Nitrosomonadaceae bacterium]